MPEADASRAQRPLEALFQEIVRRGASLGFSSFFLTEEAIRRAFADRVPEEWIEYLSRQGGEVRSDIAERLAKEFGSWLRTLDLPELVGQLLEQYEVSAKVELIPRGDRDERPRTTLSIATRRSR